MRASSNTDHRFSNHDLYVSPDGNDNWSGRLDTPNESRTDGPLATLAGARDAIRELKRTGALDQPLTVWIRDGRYQLTEPVVFGPEDSAPVTYASYPGEEAVLDGGKKIEGWRVEEKDGKTIWVTELPEVEAGKWYFHQLFVNGNRRPRTRLPKQGYYWIEDVPDIDFSAQLFEGSDRFQCAPGDIKNWHNLTDVDVVVLHYWIEERMPVASFDEETNMVTSSRRSIFSLKDDFVPRYARYYVENVFEALSEPGEWYLDRSTGKLYYIPMPGEHPETAQAFAPVATQLLRLEGNPEKDQFVEFLRFRGLSFQHTEWQQPAGGGERFNRPGIDFAAAPQAAFNIPGIIYMRGACNCVVEDCEIEHIGWYGIELSQGCKGNRIIHNHISDVGAGGIKLDGGPAGSPQALHTGNNWITDNTIHIGGRVFHSAVGILSVHSFANRISHNHIHDLFYSGISCGWVWGYADNISKDNLIEKNHIHNLGQGLLSDMGGIYTLGVQPGTVIRGNLIHDIEKSNYGGWAIYPDEGSSHIIIENNICYRTSSQCFHQHYGRENIVRNNIFAFGREGQIALGRGEEHNSFTFEKNIVISAGQPLFIRGYAGGFDQHPFISDLNLFWDISDGEMACGGQSRDENARWSFVPEYTLEEFRQLGYDMHSIVADPKCSDPENGDFTLADDSPALSLGFKPIDMSDLGPRPRGAR